MQTSSPLDHRGQRAARTQRKQRFRRCFLATLSCLAALASMPLRAVVQDQTPEGIPYTVGGIGADEVDALMQQRSAYSLSIRLAAARSGAYIADAHLRIVDAAGAVRFERDVHASWLLINLPPGRYVIEASYASEMQRQALTLGSRDHRETVLYFAVPGETVPHRADED